MKQQNNMQQDKCCPKCQTPAEGHTQIRGTSPVPVPGSILVCFYCQSINFIDYDNTIQIMPDAMLQMLYFNNPGLQDQINKLITIARNAQQYKNN